MTTFTLEITDADQLNGLTQARQRYNNDNPDSPMKEDRDYVQFVLNSACHSYAKQAAVAPLLKQVKEAEVAVDDPTTDIVAVVTDAEAAALAVDA